MAKVRVRPSLPTFSASMSRRRMRTQSEWKVAISGLASEEWPRSLFDALAHLAGGLVGEGDGEDGVGRDAFLANEPGDAAGDDAGLAGACAGEDEQRPLGGFNGGALFGIQIGDERLHGAGPGGKGPWSSLPASEGSAQPAAQKRPRATGKCARLVEYAPVRSVWASCCARWSRCPACR